MYHNSYHKRKAPFTSFVLTTSETLSQKDFSNTLCIMQDLGNFVNTLYRLSMFVMVLHKLENCLHVINGNTSR